MTTTLTLEVKALPREKAKREGQNIDPVANLILLDVLAAQAQERAEAFKGVGLGLDNFAAGY